LLQYYRAIHSDEAITYKEKILTSIKLGRCTKNLAAENIEIRFLPLGNAC
jgi:hypothetical protein